LIINYVLRFFFIYLAYNRITLGEEQLEAKIKRKSVASKVVLS